MEVKIAHCSDFHLGVKNGSSKTAITNVERKKILLEVIEKCKQQAAQLLLISGDFFDDVKVSPSEVEEIKTILSSCPEIKIFISPGNHDPFTPDSPYAVYKWPQNVYIFKNTTIDYFELPELRTRVWGAAFRSIYQTEGMLSEIPELSRDFLNICMMHGTVTAKDKDYYNPIKLSEMENSHMNYIALGHIHKKTPISKINDTFYAYSGSPFGNGFGETGDKGIYIGIISQNNCDLKFQKINSRNYEKLTLTLHSADNCSELSNFIIKEIKHHYGENFAQNLYEITLSGSIKEDFLIDPKYLELLLQNKLFFVKIIDKTTVEINVEKLAFRNDFKSMFIKKTLQRIDAAQSEEEKNLLEKALKIGIKAFTEDITCYED